jgi:hypothetical protein
MRIGAILRRWIEILAALYLAWRETRRELRPLGVTRENGHVVVRHAKPARDVMLRDARAVEDPLLRTTLSLRAFWRRGTP